jgi:hypothetical protein
MNPKAHVLRLDLPGHWADGWLYKEHLILWSDVGQMLVCPVKSLVESVEKQVDHEIAVMADFLLFRTDWKRSAQFKRLASLDGVEESFLAGFGEASDGIVIELPGAAIDPITAAQVPGFMLDSGIYNNCVYAGTTEGLFETRFDPDAPTVGTDVIQRLDKRVSALTARYSVVNTSAGDAGLLLSRMNFDEGSWRKGNSPPKRVADYSRGNSFAKRDLLNYTDDPFPGFMRSEVEKEEARVDSESDRVRITDYDMPSDIAGVLRSALGIDRQITLIDPESGYGTHQVHVLGNIDKKLLVAYGESLRVVNLTVSKKARDVGAKASDYFPRFPDAAVDPSDILSTHAVDDGFLVELPDEVRLINSHGSFSVLSEPVAHSRTFNHSRRYPDVALVVREDCVSLLGTYMATQQDSP